MTSRTLKFTSLAVLLIIVFAIMALWWLWSIPFSQTTLKKLAPGMTEAQVVSILGTANQTNQAAGSETWLIYDHPVSIRAVIVRFNASGRMIEYVVD